MAALVNRAYRGEVSRAGWTTEADLLGGQRVDEAMIDELVGAQGSVVLLAEGTADPTPLVACCHVRRGSDHAAVGMVAVRPDRQGSGLGRLLLTEAEGLARRWGLRRLRISVIQHRHELIDWYERRGFRRTGDHEPFPYGDERYGIPRRDDLVLVVMERPVP